MTIDDDDDEWKFLQLRTGLAGADGGAINKRLGAENGNGRIKQGEEEAGDDKHEADATAAVIALTEHWAQPTNHTAQQSRLRLHRRLHLSINQQRQTHTYSTSAVTNSYRSGQAAVNPNRNVRAACGLRYLNIVAEC